MLSQATSLLFKGISFCLSTVFILCTLPLFFCRLVFQFYYFIFNLIRQMLARVHFVIFSKNQEELSIFTHIYLTAKALVLKLQGLIQNRNQTLERPVYQQQLASAIESASPIEIADTQKVHLLMQKMRRLEQVLYQESLDRRKAESQLFDLKKQVQEKNSDLVKQKNEKIQNASQINVLNLELVEKTESLEKSVAYVVQLEKEIAEMKEKMQKVIQENENKLQEYRKSKVEVKPQAQPLPKETQSQPKLDDQPEETKEEKTEVVDDQEKAKHECEQNDCEQKQQQGDAAEEQAKPAESQEPQKKKKNKKNKSKNA